MSSQYNSQYTTIYGGLGLSPKKTLVNHNATFSVNNSKLGSY